MRLLPTRVRRALRAAPHHPRVHGVGNHHPVHALVLPLVWAYIQHTAFGGVDVRARALGAVPRAYLHAGAVDVGCAVGHMTRALAPHVRGGPLVGVDASREMLAVARLGGPARAKYVWGDGCLDALPAAGLYTFSFVMHEMPPAAHYTALRNAFAANRTAAVLVVDIDPSVDAPDRPGTGDEPYLTAYRDTVESTIADVARERGKGVTALPLVPGQCKAWVVA